MGLSDYHIVHLESDRRFRDNTRQTVSAKGEMRKDNHT